MNCIYCDGRIIDAISDPVVIGSCDKCNAHFVLEKDGTLIRIEIRNVRYNDSLYWIDIMPNSNKCIIYKVKNGYGAYREFFRSHLIWIFPSTVIDTIDRAQKLVAFS